MTLKFLVAAFLLCLAQSAHSAVIYTACVSDAAGLVAALTQSLTNGASIDTIRLHSGTYASGGNVFGSGGSYASGDAITIEGGWTGPPDGDPCQTQSNDPTLTVIDGQGLRGGFQLIHQAGPGSITVRNMTFANGHREGPSSNNDRGGGLYISGSSGDTADVLVERCIFRNNYALFLGGGLHAGSDGGTVTVRNNLAVDNSSQSGAALYVFGNNDFSYISNNTATGNSATAIVTTATLDIGGDNSATVTNNIFWGNISAGQSDVYGPQLLLISNDIEMIAQTPAAGSSGNLSVNPKFLGSNNFHLVTASPLIDIGTNSPLGGLAALDLDGSARIQSGTVDLGAYEYSLLFHNGFE